MSEASEGISAPATYAEELVELTNEARGTEGLEPLKISECAESAALGRAEALVDRELEHAPLKPVLVACEADSAAENLVDSDAPAHDVVDAWMSSPGHRNNIVDARWSHLGVSCVQHSAELLCSQIFLAPSRD
nr:hypothetical protein DA06_04295 [Georgenia sp. SUBG003]